MNLGFRLIDFVRKTSILKHYNWLCSFNGKAADLAQLQKERLTRLLLCIQSTNSFYGPLLREIKTHAIETDPYSILKQLPVMDKDSIRTHRKQLTASLSGRFEQSKKTGGSTGAPFYYKLDAESISLSWAYTLYCWRSYAGYSPGDPYATIAGSSLRSVHNRTKEFVYHAFQNNYLIPAETITPEMTLDANRLSKVKLLFGYPTVLHNLVTANPHFPDMLHNLQAIFTTSEQLQPQVREFLLKAFPVKIFDMYGANDGGLISCEDHSHNGFRYHPLNCLIEEFADGTGNTELLLTSLNAWTFPLIRYRVGDLARAEQPGQAIDNNPFPLIHDLKGRTRDLVRLPSGKIIHGSAFNVILYGFTQIIRYSILQNHDYSVSIQIQTSRLESQVPSALLVAISELVGDEVHVDIQQVKQFPISDRKFKLIESHVLEN